ncbi:MAG: hypothetical protein ABL977_10770 [Candidatus Eisenbacteria bacterium]
MSRAMLVRAYFAAIKRTLSERNPRLAKRALRLAKRISGKLAEQDRPRYWWSE